MAFTDVIRVEREGYTEICYRSGLTVYAEKLDHGRYYTLSWNGAGAMPGNYTLIHPRVFDPEKHTCPVAFRVDVDGQSLTTGWTLEGLEKAPLGDSLKVEVRLRSSVRPVRVTLHTLLDGTAVFSRWLTVENLSDQRMLVSQLDPMCGALLDIPDWKLHTKDKTKLVSVGYMEESAWGHEGSFEWHDLPAAELTVRGRSGSNQRHRHPMFVIRNNVGGEYFIGQLAYSGSYALSFQLDANLSAPNACVSFRVGCDAPAPLHVIEAGTALESPRMHMGMCFGGLDEAVNQMHDHVRKSVIHRRTDNRDCLICLPFGAAVPMTEEIIAHRIRQAKEIGAEVFYLDAGWSIPAGTEARDWWATVGDWDADPGKHPDDLKTVREMSHAAGLPFGLWFEMERFGNKSRIAKEHPEWIAKDYSGLPSASGQIDLCNPEAAKWMEDTICQCIERYQLDFFRLDYNTDPMTGVLWESEGDAVNGYMRYSKALYGIYDRVRAKYPHVILENCAGGGRTDLGMIERFDQTWVTDWQVAPRSFMITSGMTMALPPEFVDREVFGQSGWIAGDILFQLRLLYFCHPTIGSPVPAEACENEDQLRHIRHFTDVYRNFIRPFIRTSKIYHHTPDISMGDMKGVGILELAAEDGSRAVLGAFRLCMTGDEEAVIHPRGVNADCDYRVTFENSGRTCVVSGYDLINTGVRVSLRGPLTSETLLLETVACA